MDRRSMLLGAGGLVGAAVGAQLAAASTAAADDIVPAPPTVFDVRALGAGTGDPVKDDRAFRDAFASARAVPGGATVLIPPGSYRIATPLVLTAGMTISAYGATITRTAANGALVKNFAGPNEVPDLAATPVASKYGAPGSLAVLGGTWDMAATDTSGAADAMGFAHCSGVLVQDCTILNVPAAHAIELNAVRHARIVNCVFDGLYGTDRNKEAVQITGATSDANLPFGEFDNTCCQDVVISACTLRDSGNHPFGALVGDHGLFEKVTHTGIQVIGNHVESAAVHGIRVSDWAQSTVRGNTVIGSGNSGIYVQSYATHVIKGLVIEGNRISGTVDPVSGGGIVFAGPGRPSGTVVADNTVSDSRGTAGIYVDSTDGTSLTGNTVTTTTAAAGANCQGIHLYRSVGATVSGNTVTGADGDGIAVDQNSYGALLTGNQVTAPTMNGIWIASSDAVVRGNLVTGANAAGSTSPARYGIRIGGNSANVSCHGNTVRKAVVGAAVPAVTAAAAIGVMAGSTGTWVLDNDLRGWGSAALADAGTGTLTTPGNPG